MNSAGPVGDLAPRTTQAGEDKEKQNENSVLNGLLPDGGSGHSTMLQRPGAMFG